MGKRKDRMEGRKDRMVGYELLVTSWKHEAKEKRTIYRTFATLSFYLFPHCPLSTLFLFQTCFQERKFRRLYFSLSLSPLLPTSLDTGTIMK